MKYQTPEISVFEIETETPVLTVSAPVVGDGTVSGGSGDDSGTGSDGNDFELD